MKTIDYIGSGQLIDRLASQVGSKQKAIAILQRRGHLMQDGKTFTEDGMRRNAMTASDRAIDRASKRLGVGSENFDYDVLNNKAKRVKL
jgi:hypothetical protein